MIIFLITLIILVSLITFIILIIFRYRSFFTKIKLIKRKKKKERSLDQALDKYIGKKSKDGMKDKLAQISEIITQTEAHIEHTVKQKVKIAKSQLKIKESEEELINKVKMEYSAFVSNFKSAMPRTEEERVLDMKELQGAISMLETFDEDAYEVESKAFDPGVGMFYDKMSRRFLSIINENNLNKFAFIPINHLKYHAFSNIKNIKDKDILPILNAMKDTKLLSNIIEINPTFQIIVFTNGEKLEFSLPEKVLLTFAYDEAVLTNQKLMELTEWKETYANKIIEGLIEKEIIKIKNNNIIVENFGTIEERIKWNNAIKDKIRQEKEKGEEKRKQQLERTAQLKKRLAEVEEIAISEDHDFQQKPEEELREIKFKEMPSVKTLPLPKEIKQEIKDKDALIGAMEALDEIMPAKSVEKVEGKRDVLEEESANLVDLIPEKILSYHEKFTLINGGLSQYEKIKQFIEQELGVVPEDLIRSMLEQLKDLQMINGLYKIGNYDFYLFNELSLTEDEKVFIEFAINKKPMFKENFIEGLDWDEEQILKTMKALQEKNILRIEKNEIIIPGIIQKE